MEQLQLKHRIYTVRKTKFHSEAPETGKMITYNLPLKIPLLLYK